MYPHIIFSSLEALAKTLVSVDHVRGFTREKGRDYFIWESRSSKKKGLAISSGKMLKVLLALRRDGTLPQFKLNWPRSGMILDGKFSTEKNLEFPKIELESSFSGLLEKKVPEKYFLEDQTSRNLIYLSKLPNQKRKDVLGSTTLSKMAVSLRDLAIQSQKLNNPMQSLGKGLEDLLQESVSV